MLKLDPAPKIVTFDCYGTLVQWQRAVRDAARSILAGQSSVDTVEDEAAELANTLRTLAMEHQQRPPFRNYKSILRTSLDEALTKTGHTTSADQAEMLLSTLRRIEPHPEVPDALSRLRACYRLAIISNTDDDLIAETVAAIGTPIDFVITAEQAQAYKPDHRLFLHAYATMGVTKDETIHVGMGQVTDMKVCHELGIRSVWIDRGGETPNPAWPSDAVLRDLSSLPGLLLPPSLGLALTR